MHKDLYRARAAACLDDPDLDQRRQGGRSGAATGTEGQARRPSPVRITDEFVSVVDLKFIAEARHLEGRDQRRHRAPP